ncbi:MAG TPA: CU044_2847 family protein [Phenylobacterium sp.]
MEQALRFSDSVVVQVAGPPQPGEPVSGAATLGRRFDDVIKDVGRVLGPVIAQVSDTLTDRVETCEVELAFSFTAEGNVFLCKATGEASITVKATLKKPGKKAAS